MTDTLTVHRHTDPAELGDHAGRHAAEVITAAIAADGHARVMLAAAPSQAETLRALAASDVDFSRVEFFHMDDYLGLEPGAPQGFATWLRANFLDRISGEPQFHAIDSLSDAEASAASYGQAMGDEPFALTLCGLGVNGHLAFNDPPADFADPQPVRVVALDPVSQQQQVDEGHFPDLAAVPTHAITVTIPRLLNAAHVICSVPGAAKRQAVRDTLGHAPEPAFPGTALHTHPDAHLYVDAGSDPDA